MVKDHVEAVLEDIRPSFEDGFHKSRAKTRGFIEYMLAEIRTRRPKTGRHGNLEAEEDFALDCIASACVARMAYLREKNGL